MPTKNSRPKKKLLKPVTTPKKIRKSTPRKQFPSADSIIDGINIGVYRTSPGKKGTFLEVNQAFAKMLEASSKEELKQHNVIEIYANPKDRDTIRQLLFTNGSINHVKMQFKTLKGHCLWVLLTATLRKNSKGEQYFEGFAENITNQQLITEQLQKEKIFVDSLDIGIFHTSPGEQGNFIEINNALAKMFEASSKDELQKYSVKDVYANPDDRNKFRQQILSTGKVDHMVFKFKTLKGNYFWGSLTANLRITSQGEQFFEGFLEDITAAKLAIEQLQQEKTLSESIVATAVNGILVVDATGKAILFNQHFAEIFGIPPEILKTQDGNKMSQYVLHQLKDPKKFIQQVKELYLHRELKSRDEVAFKDGRFLDRYSSPLIDANNTYRGRIWFFRDITEQKNNQEAILQTKLLNESIVATTANGILVVNETGKAILFNQRFVEMFGIPSSVLKTQDGNKMSQYVLRQLKDPKKFIQQVKELYLHRELKSRDEVAFKDGHILDRYSSPLIDANNNYRGRVWFFHDITEQKHIQAAILQAKTLNESIINTAIDGILVVDQQGKALVFNQRFSEMFNIPPAVLNLHDGNKMSQFVLTQLKYPQKFIAGIKELFLHPNLQSSDEVEFKDGRFLDRYSSPLVDASGNNYGRVWFFRDITERKRSAEARFQNIFENSPGALGEADFSALKIHLDKLQASGITNIELYLKTHKNEVYNCIKLLKFSDINHSFLKLYEVDNEEEFIRVFFAHLEKEKLETAIKLICAVAANQPAFSADLEDITQQNNKVEVTFQYTISPGYEDFSKVLIAMVDVTRLKQIEKQLAYSAVHDPLTNLPNRILFNETLNNSIYRSKRTNDKMALLYLDVDNFKFINDSQGHDAGDLVLIELGKRLKSNLRQDDFVGRLGGDEFAVVLNGLTSTSQAGEIAKKIKNKIDGIYHVTNTELHVTTSIGIAVCPDNSENPAELIKYADIALYSVKNSGRDNYKYHLAWANFFPKVNLEHEITLALEQKQFFVVYQPQYDIKTNKIVGIEAFVRWQHESLGLIFPDNFIPLIENKDIIVELGHMIMEKCCTQYMQWLANCSDLPNLTLNLCANQLLHNNFSIYLAKLLTQTGMPPQRLEFDLNEITITNNLPRITEIVQQIKAKGIRINLDNVNNNTSLLKQTQTLCIEKIKIEQSLISNILGDTKAAMILHQILGTAKKYNLQVVVIGIENKAQLGYLLDNECTVMQGYYLCKPLTTEEMTKLLHAGTFF